MSPTTSMDARGIPRVAADAEFVPAEDVAGSPHVVVDGPRLAGTALSLSHWPRSGTPGAFAADTSAEIVDRYLRSDPGGEILRTVTNNHYDEDGLFGIWLLLERPAPTRPEHTLALAAARAGDFGTWTDPWAARVAIAAMRMAERGRTPFPEVGRALARTGARDPAGALYRAILPRTGGLLADPERYRMLWNADWEGIEADLALIDSGEAILAEEPSAGLAVVRAPRPLHDMAVHPRTDAMRILSVTPDGTMVLRDRYETWVDYPSRRLTPRTDLSPILPALQAAERQPGTWRFDGVEPIRPRLYLAAPDGRAAPSSLGVERLVATIGSLVPVGGGA